MLLCGYSEGRKTVQDPFTKLSFDMDVRFSTIRDKMYYSLGLLFLFFIIRTCLLELPSRLQ